MEALCGLSTKADSQNSRIKLCMEEYHKQKARQNFQRKVLNKSIYASCGSSVS